MPLPRNAVLVALAFFFAARVHAGDAPTPAEIARAIKELGDDGFAVREQASKFLWAAGRPAEAALQAALKSGDAEVANRARAILDHFEYGVYPDTPRNIVDLVQRFRSGTPASRPATVKDLLALGLPGYAVVAKIATAEKEPHFRRTLYEMLRVETPRIVTALLIEDKLDAVEDLLEQNVRRREAGSGANPADSCRDYAALLLLRGTLDKKIAALAAEPKLAREPRTAEVLAFFHRANGDLASAFRAAEHSGDRALQRWLLWEQGKWGELLERHPPRIDMKGAEEIQILGYQAAFERLAGRTKEFDKTVAEIRRYAEGKTGDSSDIWFSAEALFLNDRPQDAIDVLIQAKRYGWAFEMLTDQKRYREAFALADKVKAETHKEAFYLEIQRACALYEVGEKEKALPLVARLAESIKDSTAEDWVFGHLVGSEIRLGLKDLAFEHAALILARPKFSNQHNLFYYLLGDKNDGADLWWSFLRQRFPADDERATLKRLRAIVEGTIERKELLTLAEAAAAWPPAVRAKKDKGDKDKGESDKPTKETRERWLDLLGKTCLAAGLQKDAQRYFEDAIEVAAGRAPLLRLADFLAEKKLWERAAALYGQAWESDKRAPTPLFLQGWALVQAGQKEHGEKLMKLAHWLPLANVEARYTLGEALAKRGLREWAAREWEFSARIGDMDDWYTSNARRNRARAASAKGRFLEAAALRECQMLRCLNTNTGFIPSSAYITVPHQVHRLRARGLLAEGKTDEALQEIQTCLAFLPGDVDMPILLTPLLEKSGHKKEADDLFAKAFLHCERLCADHPRWAEQHNQLAWLAGRCRRQLDKALTHAEKAVALSPKSASFLDTLAEVHFQRGDGAKAIELIGRCLELEPGNDFYRRQLKRFEAGDRLVDVPSRHSP